MGIEHEVAVKEKRVRAFLDEAGYDALKQGDEWEITGIHAALRGGEPLTVHNLSQDQSFQANYSLTERQINILLAGGLLNYIKAGG